MTQLTVPAPERQEPALRLGVTTLPDLFAYATDAADVTGIIGTAGWVVRAEAAVRGGARGVLVVDPAPDDLSSLLEAIREHSTPIVVDHGWASSPSTEAAAPAFRRLNAPGSLAECRIDAPPGAQVDQVLLRQLALVRATVGAVTELRLVRSDPTGYDALGTVEGGADLSLSCVFTQALPEGATVRIVRPEATALLHLGPVDVARPGTLCVLEGSVETRSLTPYETPHRGAWRRLHTAVTGSLEIDELEDLAGDVARVASGHFPRTGTS